MYGGSITAILINTPGTPNSAATTLDGYPLAKQGRGGDALKVALFGLCATISLSKENILKGVISALLGLLVCCVGMDPVFGTSRMLFGSRSLLAGFRAVTCMLGIYALSQVLFECNTARKQGDKAAGEIKVSKGTVKIRHLFRYWKTIIKSSVMGIIIGAIPGTGGAIAAMFSYNEARRSSKHPEEFGKGSIEGVLAPEVGNNAVTGATMIPMLTMGIPGDAIMAIMLGALTMQGISPGAGLFEEGSIWVYAIMGGLIVINIFMLIQGSAFIKLFVNVTRIPENMLLPCIVVLCIMGSFAISNTMLEVGVLIAFSLIGFLMKKFDIPVIPFTIALVLGTLCETNLRRSLMISYGDPTVFFTRPISCIVLIGSVLLLVWPGISGWRKARRGRKSGKGQE